MAVESKHITSVNTIADLRLYPGANKNPVLILGNASIGDGAAAHYYWDDTNTDPEDNLYLNTIKVTDVAVGRWKKVIARVVTVPQGLLVYSGGLKTLYVDTVVAADGTASINLTMDNTTNGAAIFTKVMFDDSKATVNTSTPVEAVSSCRKSLSANLKQLTHLFFRGNTTAVGINVAALANTNINGQRTAATGTTVTFKVEGI